MAQPIEIHSHPSPHHWQPLELYSSQHSDLYLTALGGWILTSFVLGNDICSLVRLESTLRERKSCHGLKKTVIFSQKKSVET